MSRSPPLRFVLLLLAGWAGLRAAWLAPFWAPPAGAGARPRPADEAGERRTGTFAAVPAASPRPRAPRARFPAAGGRVARLPHAPEPLPARAEPVPGAFWSLEPGIARRRAAPSPAPGRPVPGPAAKASRWSAAAWSFLRDGDSAALAAGGLLGGSQAGLRLAYRLNRDPARPLALAARLSAPLGRAAGAEAALGVEWRPSRRLPVRLLGERRQRLGGEGRSAFALTVHGGVDDAALGPLRVDAYAQAGLVGARSLDRFADGALRLSLPAGRRLRLGVGAWAAAQPGLARLDLGPQASFRLPLAGRNVTLAADWRRRLAGNARPVSGPTLTVASDF